MHKSNHGNHELICGRISAYIWKPFKVSDFSMDYDGEELIRIVEK